ncbi:MAG: universal stress protein [Acidobacteria bacterium]|nr:universal stress protein [Acidobacteriota bacterium]
MSTIALRHILVPTDFSDCSTAALRYGLALAERFDAHLHVLHTVQNPFDQPWAAEVYAVSEADFEKTARAAADTELARLLEQSGRRADQVTSATTVGTPFLAIVTYAKEAPIDLIVMGTHGRGALAHLLIGSVAENVVRKAPCPVLTVHHPEHEFVAP